MARKIELFRDTQPDDAYADVARREAYAKALQEMAARQRGPAPGGRVQAQYGIGEGLTQLAEALLARRAGRQAIETRNAADANTRVQNEGVINDLTMDQRPQKIDAQGQPIAGTEPQQMLDIDTGRPELSARGQALARAVAGQDPQQIRQFLMQQQLSRLLPDPSQVADRDLKRMQIEGGLQDRGLDREQRLLERNMRSQDLALNREQRAAAAAESAALRREIASGQQQTQRDIAGMNDKLRRDELNRKIEADKKTAPNVTAKDSAGAFLSGINYDPQSGEDDVTNLLSKASGGALQAVRDVVGRTFNYATEGAKASQSLKSRASESVLNFLGGKLGAGVSNADREFMLQRAGDIGNEYLSNDERLSAWKDVRQRMIDAQVRAGSEQPHSQMPNPEDAPARDAGRTVVKTGTLNGRKVVQYSDGTTEYAD